ASRATRARPVPSEAVRRIGAASASAGRSAAVFSKRNDLEDGDDGAEADAGAARLCRTTGLPGFAGFTVRLAVKPAAAASRLKRAVVRDMEDLLRDWSGRPLS